MDLVAISFQVVDVHLKLRDGHVSLVGYVTKLTDLTDRVAGSGQLFFHLCVGLHVLFQFFLKLLNFCHESDLLFLERLVASVSLIQLTLELLYLSFKLLLQCLNLFRLIGAFYSRFLQALVARLQLLSR